MSPARPRSSPTGRRNAARRPSTAPWRTTYQVRAHLEARTRRQKRWRRPRSSWSRKPRPSSRTSSPRDAMAEVASGRAVAPRRPGAGRVGAPHRRRRPGAARAARVRRRPDKPATQAGARPARRRVIVYCRSGARAVLAGAHPEGRWATRTWPTSTAASPPGRKPACRSRSTTRTCDVARSPSPWS